MIRAKIFAIFIIFMSSPSWAVTNQSLYEMCTQYKASGYDLENKNYQVGSLLCEGYISSSIEQAQWMCRIVNIVRETNDDFRDFDTKFLLSQFATSATIEDRFDVIENFLNYVENNQKYLNTNPHIGEWLAQEFPCDLK